MYIVSRELYHVYSQQGTISCIIIVSRDRSCISSLRGREAGRGLCNSNRI